MKSSNCKKSLVKSFLLAILFILGGTVSITTANTVVYEASPPAVQTKAVTYGNYTRLAASDSEVSDRFGNSVSVSGDYAIVGAPCDDDAGQNSGSAYIFRHDGESWTEQAKLTAGDGAAFDHFGNSVSVSGDYAIVSAPYDDDAGQNSGSAYIFRHDGESWTEQAKLTAGSPGPYRHFGRSVSIDGNYAIVGALGKRTQYNTGEAYVFKREGESWVEHARLTTGDSQQIFDYFGRTVAISGDYAIVGAHGDDGAGYNSGSAYVFTRNGSSWTEQAKLIAGDAAKRDRFGRSVAISGDYAVVGAKGSAYIFKRDGSVWTEQSKLSGNKNFFGRSVAISGDYAVVGASNSAYIFRHDGPEWTERTEFDRSGRPVAIDGAYAIIDYTEKSLFCAAILK